MTTFKVGEIAIIVGMFSGRTDVIGAECEIVSTAQEWTAIDLDRSLKTKVGHLVKPLCQWDSHIPVPGDTIVVAPHHLRKLPTRNEPATWQESFWRPTGGTV